MRIVFSEGHRAYAPPSEFEGGRLTPAVETPKRAESVLQALRARKLGPIEPPMHFGHEPILRVHDAEFLHFLRTAMPAWRAHHGADSNIAFPSNFPGRALRQVAGRSIEGQIGYYAFDTATPLMDGTWEAALTAVNVALTAARHIDRGQGSAFALTRPPGHHAAADLFGGYCFLNNAAIAAQFLVDQGARPAILDVDYHHGNGTQAIFYERSELLFVSIHADPAYAYPHYLGYADETGQGPGLGYTLNLPLPTGTEWPAYAEALTTAMASIRAFGADTLVVSLGLDTYEKDPISKFRLKADDYSRLGQALGSLRIPALFVLEGGYAVDDLGLICANVLEGFQGA